VSELASESINTATSERSEEMSVVGRPTKEAGR
jgi:hypothetical protein